MAIIAAVCSYCGTVYRETPEESVPPDDVRLVTHGVCTSTECVHRFAADTGLEVTEIRRIQLETGDL